MRAAPRREGRFAPFVAVGALGFAIDASILTVLVSIFGWSTYAGRAVSFAAAVTATWLSNRRWVFERTADARKEYGAYLLTQIVGATINLGGFALLIELFPPLARFPVVPLAGGGIIALVFNFFAARRWVFAAQPSPAGSAPASKLTTGATRAPYAGADNLEIMLEAENYNRYLLELIRRHLGTARNVIDFGAGTGTFAARVTTFAPTLTSVEPDAGLRDALARQGLAAVADVRDLPDAAFDYAYTLNVLEHIEDDTAALRELHRKLVPGGRLLVYVPAFHVLYTSMDQKVGHVRRYTRATLIAAVTAAGFAVEYSRYADSLGFFATLAFKLFGNARGTLDRSAIRLYDRRVFPLSRALDALVSPLFGKNLLLVAIKPTT